MESIYSTYIPEDLARQMLNVGFPLYKYGIGGYDGKPSFFTVDEDNPMWETCDRFQIPTYAEALDMFLDRDIIISIEPQEDCPIDEIEFSFTIYYKTNHRFVSGACKSFEETLQYAVKLVILSQNKI